MPEPCPRGCGKPSEPRHTCKPRPGDPDPHGCKVTEESYEASMSELEKTQDELMEIRRKASHYHAQRMEADERNAELEALARDLAGALRDADEVGIGDGMGGISQMGAADRARTTAIAALDRARAAGVLP